MELTIEQKIETMLRDTVKGLATREELSKAVNEVVKEELLKADAKTKQLQDTLTELEKSQIELMVQVKNLLKTRFAAIKDADGNYNGMCANMEQSKAFGFFVAASYGNQFAIKQLDEMGIKLTKAANSQDPSAGGFLVPVEFRNMLLVLQEQYGVYRIDAQRMPMTTDNQVFPTLTGELTVYCPGAGVAPTESELGFGRASLKAQKWMVYVLINSELDEDSAVAIGEVAARQMARAFAKQEDLCGFVGDGTATYFNAVGIRAKLRAVDATVTNIKGLQVQATAGAWSAISLTADLLPLAGRLPDYADDADAKFYCSKMFYLSVIVAKALGLGGAYAAEATYTGYTRNPQFLGRPVKFTSAMPKTIESADHCPLIFGNLKMGSYFGDRRQMTVERSNEVKFLEDQIALKASQRVDINNFGVGDTTDAGPLTGLWADIA